ncbi:MAG: VWA domain-containing protein, partial [Acidobacteriota bacterium]
LVLLACLMVLFLLSQEQVEVTVTNIIVPVRVTEAGHFVDNLTTEDFELLEDGTPQKIQALYLVRKSEVQRKEAGQEYTPALHRTFFFLFQMTEYNPKLAEMIDYFFNHVLLPGDAMVLQTPMKNYSLSPQAVASTPKKVMADQMNNLLRKDIKMGNSDYESILRELKRIVRSIAGTGQMADVDVGAADADPTGLEFRLDRYHEMTEKMETSRLIDQKKILGFAYALKRVEGQKHVFFVYQREFRPEIPSTVLNNLVSFYQDEPNIQNRVQDLFGYYTRNITLNVDGLKKAFADCSINFNLIFMNQEPKDAAGVAMREQSEDVFRAFSQIARATGGIVDTSQNPAAGFRNAVESAEAYYLLYYSPENYKKDKQFKTITVRAKNPNYSVLHRMGYFAN